MADIQTTLQAQAIAQALNLATGQTPVVTDYGTYTDLSFTPEQVENLKGKLRNQVAIFRKRPATPEKIKINLEPVIVPVVFEQIAPYAIGALAAAFLAGYLVKGKR